MKYLVTNRFPVPNQYGYTPGMIVDRAPDDLTNRYVAKGYLEPAPVQEQKDDKQIRHARVK